MSLINFSSILELNHHKVITASDMRTYYLSGIPLPDFINDDWINWCIASVLDELETYLSIKLRKQIIIEDKDFSKDDWQAWGFIKTTYPVVCAYKMDGFLGTTKQVTYPGSWLSTRQTSDNKNYSRSIYLVPNRNSSHSESLIYSGILPQAQYFNSKTIPNYWTLEYVTGWDADKIPAQLYDAVCQMALASMLQSISDALMAGTVRQTTDSNGQPILVSNAGFGLGLSSKSISIDGLSQSTSSFVNGQTGLFGARLKQLLDNLNPSSPGSLMNRLYDQYAAITMGVA